MTLKDDCGMKILHAFSPAKSGLGASFSTMICDRNGGQSSVEISILNELPHFLNPIVLDING